MGKEKKSEKEIGYKELKGKSFSERLRMTPVKNWVKLALIVALILFFMVWSSAWWLLLLIPLAVDVYVTKYVYWSKWKNEQTNPVMKTVAEWVDAIVFALVAVYFIHNYFFQNYKIPTPSLEKTLLVGDLLLVNKLSYGPREPMTPLSFPLVHHTFPILNCQSYIENPQWEYSRLKGFGEVQRNDIVVFNFPAGDTVALLAPNQDYYSAVNYFGRDHVWNNPDKFGEIKYRPVDRRENYVKRCVALPGDTFLLKDGVVFVNGVQADDIETLQFNYYVETSQLLSQKVFEKLNVRVADRMLINEEIGGVTYLQNMGYVDSVTGSLNYVYRVPLTQGAVDQLKRNNKVVSIRREPVEAGGKTFPFEREDGWTRDDYGPLCIPKQGVTVELNMYNLPLYEKIIRNYELNDLRVDGGEIFINGKKCDQYTFKMDYYWMMGDNRHNSADSRYWGFVPMDHIVGKPVYILLSFDEDKSFFKSIRWDRVLTKVHPD